MLALLAVLLIAAAAGLFSPRPGSKPNIAAETREEFIQFGKDFFAIARKADQSSEQAFKALESMLQGGGSIEDVHSAFREASTANGQAANDFKGLEIPASLQSQSNLTKSVDAMSRAYYARKLACDILVDWNGDLNDQVIADKYTRQVQDINRLTQEGLALLANAARDNGITEDDASRFLPAAILSEESPFQSFAVPWRR